MIKHFKGRDKNICTILSCGHINCYAIFRLMDKVDLKSHLLPVVEIQNRNSSMDQVFRWKRSMRMKLFYSRRNFKRILLGTLFIILAIFFFVFIIVPVIFRYSYGLQRSLLFLNFVNNGTDLKTPWKQGLIGSRNLYIDVDEGVKLGVWHILPSSKLPGLVVDSGILNRGTTDELYNKYLGEGQPIFIYHHGNAGNRASKHRLELYKVLQKNNYHVVAFDYRSYGDSSAVDPDEAGVVSDAKAVYKWARALAPNSNIFLWGHSLGTGVASHSIHDLEAEGNKVTGLILEAPFTNLQEEIRDYPMSRIFKPLPWFDFFFVDPTYENGLRFQSDVYLLNVTAPIMILHAEDDKVVPVHQGMNLYQRVKLARGENGTLIKFVKFGKSQGYGHDHISRDKGLSNTISEFVAEAKGLNKKLD